VEIGRSSDKNKLGYFLAHTVHAASAGPLLNDAPVIKKASWVFSRRAVHRVY